MMNPMSLYLACVPGIGGEFGGEGRMEKFVASPGAKKKLLVGGQAGAVGQQHADSDIWRGEDPWRQIPERWR